MSRDVGEGLVTPSRVLYQPLNRQIRSVCSGAIFRTLFPYDFLTAPFPITLRIARLATQDGDW
jgi:hypothetical protein